MSTNCWRTIRPTSNPFSLAKRRAWYVDDPSAPPADAKPEPPTEGDDKPAKTFDEAYVKELRQENAKRRQEVRTMEERLAKFEAEKKQEEEDELKEQNLHAELAKKYKAELDQTKSALEQERINNLRIRVGVEFKLPTKLIERLQGATEDDIRADAQSLVDELGLNKPAPETPATPPTPASAVPQARRQTTAVAPGGQPATESDDDRRNRLYKRGPIHSPAFKSKSE